MNISISLIRLFFISLSILFFATYATNLSNGGFTIFNLGIGVASGLIFGFLLISMDVFFKRFSLRSFNVAILGLLLGYLMGQVVLLLLSTAIDFNTALIDPTAYALLRITILLFTVYMGMVMTARAAEELHVSIPFVKFKPTSHKKKDIVIDSSILMDSRIIDLATSGHFKGKYVLRKSAVKGVERILSFAEPTHIGNIYTKKYYILLGSMMLLGILIKVLNLPSDIRGFIDSAIGTALIAGSLVYFTSAFASYKKRVSLNSR